MLILTTRRPKRFGGHSRACEGILSLRWPFISLRVIEVGSSHRSGYEQRPLHQPRLALADPKAAKDAAPRNGQDRLRWALK